MSYLLRWSLFAPIPAWVQFFLIGTLLLFPISSSAKSVCLALSVGTILFTPGFISDLRSLLSTSWCKAALLLFCIALIACLWSPANFEQKALALERYSKLLYLPIFVVGFQNITTRQLSIHAFLVAMIITCGLSIFKFHGYLQFITTNPDNIFRNHIMTSLMVAFAAYISFLYTYRHQKLRRFTYSLLGIIFTYHVLFVSASRTGYIIYFLLMLLLIIQLCTGRQAIVGMLIMSILFSVSYLTSPIMRMRINEIEQQINEYHTHKRDTDVGVRLQLHHYAHKLFIKHPLLGNGTASFTYYFNKNKPIKFWTWNLLEPHSQYWLIASEFGLIGFGALIYFFFCLIQTSRKLGDMKVLAFAMILPYMIGNLSDSLLFYSGSGYFFIFFMAIFLGEELQINNEIQTRGSFSH